MNVMDWLGFRPSLPRFAGRLLSELARAGHHDWSLSPDRTALHRDGCVVNLHNLFLEYTAANRLQRGRLLRKYCALALTMEQKITGLWPVAARSVFVAIRSRFDRAALDTKMRADGTEPVATVTWPLAGDLHIRLVYDWGESLAHVEESLLATWGQDLDSVLDVGTRNLAGLPDPVWEPIVDGVFELHSDASYGESFLLVDRIIRRLPFAADAAFLPCNRGVLLAADKRDERALTAMVRVATRYFGERPWSMAATVVHQTQGGWQELTLLGVAADVSYELHRLTMAEHYAAQKEQLDEADQHHNRDTYHASYGLMRRGEGAQIQSWCSWTEGVYATLPVADLVVFGRNLHDGKQLMLEVAWIDVLRICGELMQVTPDSPDRFAVSTFPQGVLWDDLLAVGAPVG